MTQPTARASEHPAHVWEVQRPRFTKLYKDENKTLVEVQQIMQDEYGFHASLRQYKRKIKAWNLEKNSRATEKCCALTSLKSLDTKFDLNCVYKINGKNISAHKLLRYAKSHGYELPNVACNTLQQRSRPSKPFSKNTTISLGMASKDFSRPKEQLLAEICDILSLAFCRFRDSLKITRGDRQVLLFPSKHSALEMRKVILNNMKFVFNCFVLATGKFLSPKSIGTAFTISIKPLPTASMLTRIYFPRNGLGRSAWHERIGEPSEDFLTMDIEKTSEIRFDFLQPQTPDGLIRWLKEIHEFLFQAPTEPLRIIELLFDLQNDLRTASKKVSGTRLQNTMLSDAQSTLDIRNSDIACPLVDDLLDPVVCGAMQLESYKSPGFDMFSLQKIFSRQ